MTNKIYLLAALPFLLNACIKEECKIISTDYIFEVPAKLSPANDTFNIGDTIKIVSTFPNKVYDRTTKQYYTLENFNFYPSTYIQKIDTSPGIAKIRNFFYIIIDSSPDYRFHVYNDGDEGIFGEYTYLNGVYSLEFKLVTRQKGLYYIKQGISPFIEPHQDFDGKCPREGVDGTLVMNEGADNNINMLSDSPDWLYNNWTLQKPEERFHRFGGYCFYVK